MTYRLNARGAEVLGDDPGAIYALGAVLFVYSGILGQPETDIEVAGDGLYLLPGPGGRECIAETVEPMPVDAPCVWRAHDGGWDNGCYPKHGRHWRTEPPYGKCPFCGRYIEAAAP